MKTKVFNILKYILFLAIGVFIFWLIYRKQDPKEIINAFRQVNYFWIFISLLFSVLSIVSRTLRWQLLIDSIGYKTRFVNVFLSCYVLYMINFILPRAGEIARCAVVSGTDKVPFAKIVGTMLVERLADLLMLVILAVIIFIWNISLIKSFFIIHSGQIEKIESFFTFWNIAIISVIAIILLFALIYLWKTRWSKKGRIISLWHKIKEGVYSISQLENRWKFIAHTAFIYLMWLAMLYVVFLAYGPTSALSLRAGMVTFLIGGLAMLAPIQGGMGAWHYMVSQALIIFYFIPGKEAENFALIAHTTTNLIYILFGAIALIILFFINSGKISLSGRSALKN